MSDVNTRVCAVVVLLLTTGCASRVVVPPLPSVPRYADFMFPAIPPDLPRAGVADQLDRGWRFLQNDNLREADREFAAVIQRAPAFYPAQAGAAYVALARADHSKALTGFDVALSQAPRYLPALIGRGQVLLALNRHEEALAAFEAALAVDASLADLGQRIDVLRFRTLQGVIEDGRRDAAAGRLDAARAAFVRAMAASPDTAFLHRELGAIERRQGNLQAALAQFRRAAELDPSDVVSLVQTGELLEQQGNDEAAREAYRKAAELESSDDMSARLAAIERRLRDARLPAEFRALAGAVDITRGDLAALIGIRLEPLLRAAANRQVVITDTRGHWAAPWIARVAAAGIVEPFENHTFQPNNTVRRVDLARAVSELVRLMAGRSADLRVRLGTRTSIADMDPGHLDYAAVSAAVASGVMPLDEGRFRMNGPVSGAEALDVIARLQALAGDR